jgi:two-component system response regulator AtoC
MMMMRGYIELKDGAEADPPRCVVVAPASRARERLSDSVEAGGWLCMTSDRFAHDEVELDVDFVLLHEGCIAADGAIERIRQARPDAALVVLGAASSVERAVSALKAGATDFVPMPKTAAERRELVQRMSCMTETQQDDRAAPAVGLGIGTSAHVAALKREVERAASHLAPLLIVGESGCGKEAVARRVHQASAVSQGPCVRLDCRAIPSDLLSLELLGREADGSAGAAARPGRLELAANGTLVLTEVGLLPAPAQLALRRAIEEGIYERVGSARERRCKARILALTEHDLGARVTAGQFDHALLYRLALTPIELLPLRKRREDVPALVDHFVDELCRRHGREPLAIDDQVRELLRRQPWPGNLRQLRSFLERLVLLSDDRTPAVELVEGELAAFAGFVEGARGVSPDTSSAVSLGKAVERAERKAITKALRRARGNRTLAARILGISRRTLYSKMAELGIRPEP